MDDHPKLVKPGEKVPRAEQPLPDQAVNPLVTAYFLAVTCTAPVVGASSLSDVHPSYTALIVDDEQRIRSVVIRALQLEGIEASGAADSPTALAMLAVRPYDLVILDLLMPGQDGFAVLAEIMRLYPEQAVLVLSCLADPSTKIRSLNLGADDYLPKPFHVQELLARVRARMRALHRHGQATIRCGRLTLELISHRVTVGSRRVQLAEREFQLLCELVNHPGEVVHKNHLLAHVWGCGPGEYSNVVDVYVRRLRSRLGDEVIQTVRGEGYCCVV